MTLEEAEIRTFRWYMGDNANFPDFRPIEEILENPQPIRVGRRTLKLIEMAILEDSVRN